MGTIVHGQSEPSGGGGGGQRGHNGGKGRKIIPSDGFIYGSASTVASPYVSGADSFLLSIRVPKPPRYSQYLREKNNDRDRGIK